MKFPMFWSATLFKSMNVLGNETQTAVVRIIFFVMRLIVCVVVVVAVVGSFFNACRYARTFELMGSRRYILFDFREKLLLFIPFFVVRG